MPTPIERMRHVTLKVERAKKHVANLERETLAFLNADPNPYTVACKIDPQTRKPIYYVASVRETPDCLAMIAGDAIQNLMSALDHLAYQLVCSDTGDNPPNPNWIYFPIADDCAKYETKKHGKMQGALPATFIAIDNLHPYKGGNDLLWKLYRLNNVEKHRLLLTVGSVAAGIHLGQMSAGFLEGKIPQAFSDALRTLNAFLVPGGSDKGFPLKAGFELLIGAPDTKCDPNQQFRFQVALDEPGIIEGEPLVQTIHQLVNLVEGITTSLEPLLV